jgi:LCP family protein required for cell wall assembly
MSDDRGWYPDSSGNPSAADPSGNWGGEWGGGRGPQPGYGPPPSAAPRRRSAPPRPNHGSPDPGYRPADPYDVPGPGYGQGGYGQGGYGQGDPGRRAGAGGRAGADPWAPGRSDVPPQRPGAPRPGGPRPGEGRSARAAHSGQPGHDDPDGRVNTDIDLDDVDPHGRSQRRAAAAARPKSRTGRALRWTALGLSTVMLAGAGVGGYVYVHFNGNIKTASLLPPGVTQSAEIPNQFGQTAMNILLLGNSGRLNAADCSLGHACDDNVSTADTMMVLHLAADRSNMTVMSIPRDSIVSMPSCAKAGSTNLVNATLQGGPSCSVQAVGELTGLTIDHFIEIDMAGVVTMSNAVGGVQVCVTNNMKDDYSHIKLPKGTSTIQGTQALAWLRTRHAFNNEVDREKAQHLFMASLVRKLKANASLTHISTLYSVADAATKALTVDSQLSTVTDLLSLGQELGKVPTDRISFMSVPTAQYSGTNSAWRQQLQFAQPAANEMFASIKNDQPFTAGSSKSSGSSTKTSATPTVSTSSAAAVDIAAVHAAIENGSGIGGRASTVHDALVSDGFSSSGLTTGNASQPASTTVVYYPSGRAESAAAVAGALEIPSSAVHESTSYSEVTVVIGKDWASGSVYSGSGGSSSSGTSGAPTTVASAPPDSSEATNAAQADCMQIAHPEW